MNEMYNRIDALCRKRDINMTQMCREAGVTRGAMTDLKMNRTSELSTKTLSKISTYFNVTMDLLLGSEQEKAPTNEGERPITFDDFTFAMQNEAKELTEMDKQILLSMAKQLNDARKKKDGESG